MYSCVYVCIRVYLYTHVSMSMCVCVCIHACIYSNTQWLTTAQRIEAAILALGHARQSRIDVRDRDGVFAQTCGAAPHALHDLAVLHVTHREAVYDACVQALLGCQLPNVFSRAYQAVCVCVFVCE